MHVRHPVWIQRASTPGAEAFAVLFSLESLARALLATVIPLQALELFGTAQRVSVVFFAVGLVGLCGGLCVPWLVRRSARRWVYSLGGALLAAAPLVLAIGSPQAQAAGMMVRVLGVVTVTICLNLYIMHYIARRDLGRSEPLRMFYSAGAWTVGPVLGVVLAREIGLWAVYGASALCALSLLGYFWFLRLTDASALDRPAGRAPSPLRNLRRFFAQPRLVLAWLISIARNAWWALFFIYTPIYAQQSGLGPYVGGLIVSVGTGFLFLMPLWGWCARRFGVRRMLMLGFGAAGAATFLVALFAPLPWAAAGLLVLAALPMVSLDAVGNIPFMLAVRPRERPEMTSVYSTYRDAAELAPPGVFALLLRAFDLPVVFLVGGLTMLAMAYVSRVVHPRFGRPRGPGVALARPAVSVPGGGAG